MTTRSWQPPIMFELNDLADEPKAQQAYQPPIILPDETPLHSEIHVVPEPQQTETVEEKKETPKPQAYAKPYQVQQWVQTKVSAELNQQIPYTSSINPAQQQIKQSLQNPKILPQWLIKKIKLPQEAQTPWLYSPWLWLFGGLFSLYFALLILDAVHLLQQQFQHGFLFGSLFSLIISSIFIAIAHLIWRTYQDIRQLKTVQQLRHEGERLRQHSGFGQALPYISKINRLYLHREENKIAIDRFYLAVDNCHSNAEVCTLYSQRVLQPIDQQAQAIVTKRAGETAIMVMFSPFPLLSTALTLWRNVQMMRDIAHLYSGRPSFLAAMNLSVMVIQNLIYAGVSEAIANSVARLFDKSLSAILIGQMSQGIGSAIISARIGLKTIELCRPMPFQKNEQPKLKHIAKEVADLLKSFVAKEKTN